MRNPVKKAASLALAGVLAFSMTVGALAAESKSFSFVGNGASITNVVQSSSGASGKTPGNINTMTYEITASTNAVFTGISGDSVTIIPEMDPMKTITLSTGADDMGGAYVLPMRLETYGISIKNLTFHEVSKISAGYELTFAKAGTYSVEIQTDIDLMILNLTIAGEGQGVVTPPPTDTATPETPAAPETVTAKAASSAAEINGKAVSLETYAIGENHYIKLRDFAMAVNGTEKQFNVIWNGEKNAIELTSKTAYAAVGGELQAATGTDEIAAANSSTIYSDGQAITLTAYTIHRNNFFKLRDLCQAFDIAVTWDAATSTMGIDTTKGYTAE